MRLIDADALYDELIYMPYDNIFEGTILHEKPLIAIANAPTVEMPGWISVQDRLPKKTGDYLVFTSGGVIWPYFFTEGTWFDFDGFKTESVTHWMPLPEPPLSNTIDKDKSPRVMIHNCGAVIMERDVCPNCGQVVRWNV